MKGKKLLEFGLLTLSLASPPSDVFGSISWVETGWEGVEMSKVSKGQDKIEHTSPFSSREMRTNKVGGLRKKSRPLNHHC